MQNRNYQQMEHLLPDWQKVRGKSAPTNQNQITQTGFVPRPCNCLTLKSEEPFCILDRAPSVEVSCNAQSTFHAGRSRTMRRFVTVSVWSSSMTSQSVSHTVELARFNTGCQAGRWADQNVC